MKYMYEKINKDVCGIINKILFQIVVKSIETCVQKAHSIKRDEGLCVGLVRDNIMCWKRKLNVRFVHADLNQFESRCAYWFSFDCLPNQHWDWHRISIINGKIYLCCQGFLTENYRLIPFLNNISNDFLKGCWGKISEEFIRHRSL